MKRTGVVIFFWAGKVSPLALIVLLAATFDGNKEMLEVLLADGCPISGFQGVNVKRLRR